MSDHKATKKIRTLRLPGWYLPKGTMNASDDELDEASSSCETWGLWCGALVVVAVIAEVIIAWIEPPYDLFLRLSVPTDIAIAVGIIGEVLLGMRNNRFQTELRRRSNKELADAKFALARVMTPRSDVILPNKEKIIAKILPFAGIKFDIGHSEHGREEWDFLWQFEEVPAKAGWIFLDWVPIPSPRPTGAFHKINWTMRQHVYGVANVSNVVIELDPESRDGLLPAATALVDALNEIGISASVAEIRINAISATKDAVHILVGPKG